MQSYLIPTLATLAFMSICSGLYGQSKSVVAPFPTYQQIKPATAEIVDYVSQWGEAGVVGHQLTFRLFDYPEHTVTYILNGKPTMDGKYVKEVVNRKETRIETIAIEQPSADGKQTIRIEYSTHK